MIMLEGNMDQGDFYPSIPELHGTTAPTPPRAEQLHAFNSEELPLWKLGDGAAEQKILGALNIS